MNFKLQPSEPPTEKQIKCFNSIVEVIQIRYDKDIKEKIQEYNEGGYYYNKRDYWEFINKWYDKCTLKSGYADICGDDDRYDAYCQAWFY